MSHLEIHWICLTQSPPQFLLHFCFDLARALGLPAVPSAVAVSDAAWAGPVGLAATVAAFAAWAGFAGGLAATVDALATWAGLCGLRYEAPSNPGWRLVS